MKSERWSTLSEIKKLLSADHTAGMGGPILHCQNGRHWKYTGEGHTIYVGSSGGGKSRRGTIALIMSLIDAMESFIVADPKGEIYANTASLLPPEYRKIVIDFRRILESAACNILAPVVELYLSGDPEDTQAALEMLDNIAHALYPTVEKDPFWPESARSVFIGAVCALMEYASPGQVNIANVFQLVAMGDERFGSPGNTFLKEFVSMLPKNSIASMELHSYATTAEETRAGIRSTFLQGLSKFIRSEGMTAMMSADDLHINQLDGETPTAIYIIIPDESPIYDSVCGIIINELLTHYVRMAQNRYDGRLPRRLNVCLDEFGNIGHAIPNLPHLMSAGRSRNIRCQLVLQSFAQLDSLYGPAKATTIRENASVLVAYRTNHWGTLSELSRMCGEREIDTNGHLVRESLITPSDLSAMEVGQALVMISGGTKFITWLPDFTEMFDCSAIRPPQRKPRVSRKPPEIFDIREYVKDAKRKKIDELLRGTAGPTEACPPSWMLESDSSPDISSLTARIDAKRKELEGTEKNGADDLPYAVTLSGYSGSQVRIVRALRSTLDLSLNEACNILRSLPFVKKFKTAEEANLFANTLAGAGGKVTTTAC